jgi:hypothetical protein
MEKYLILIINPGNKQLSIDLQNFLPYCGLIVI